MSMICEIVPIFFVIYNLVQSYMYLIMWLNKTYFMILFVSCHWQTRKSKIDMYRGWRHLANDSTCIFYMKEKMISKLDVPEVANNRGHFKFSVEI